jgi:hypothetical protein
MFLCADDQRLLSIKQWLVTRTNMYTVLGLFLVTTFQQELDVMFPKHDIVTKDDEPKAHQIIQFGSFLFDAKKSKMKDAALSIVAHLAAKLIFEGDNFLMKTEKKKQGNYIGIVVLALLYWNSKINC